jgi:hypothetical protein
VWLVQRISPLTPIYLGKNVKEDLLFVNGKPLLSQWASCAADFISVMLVRITLREQSDDIHYYLLSPRHKYHPHQYTAAIGS